MANWVFLERGNFLEMLEPNFSGSHSNDKEAKRNLEKTFFRNLAQLDLALSLIQMNSHIALAILDSLDNPFWMVLTSTTLRNYVPEFNYAEEPDSGAI